MVTKMDGNYLAYSIFTEKKKAHLPLSASERKHWQGNFTSYLWELLSAISSALASTEKGGDIRNRMFQKMLPPYIMILN